MQATSFGQVLSLIASFFKSIFHWLDNFYLVGTFSLLDFSVAVLIIDIIITSFFVTFNVGVSTSEYNYVDKKGRQRTGHKFTQSSSSNVGSR